MDGGSSLNILYAETLDTMGINQACVQPTRAPFHGVVPRKQALPLGQLDPPITFEGSSNYRTETITFEVVGFHGAYHIILGQPCYTKLMAVPNHTYLKLKMSGLGGVITAGTSLQRAYECEVKCCDHTTMIVASGELAALRQEVTKEVLNPKQPTGSFEPAEGSKDVLLDLRSTEGKTVRTGTTLSSK